MADEQSCACECACETTQTVNVPVTLGICVKETGNPGSMGDCGCVSYSYEEQWTGKYWVDGKKIYQKTVLFEGSLTADTTIYIPLGVAELEAMVDMRTISYCNSSTIEYYQSIPYVGGTVGNNCGIFFDVDKNAFSVKSHQITRTPSVMHITALYTCTNR